MMIPQLGAYKYYGENAIRISPLRLLAIAVIGEALRDLDDTPRSFNGKLPGAATLENRHKDAWEFINGPDLDLWARFTAMSAEAWRDVAKQVGHD